MEGILWAVCILLLGILWIGSVFVGGVVDWNYDSVSVGLGIVNSGSLQTGCGG